MMKKIVLSVGILLLLSLALSCAFKGRYPVSDHFHGKNFFNPESSDKKNFWDVLKWQFGRSKPVWPKQIPVTSLKSLPRIPPGLSVAITYVNHSTFLIQTPDKNFLTDPIWSERASPFTWAGPRRVYNPPLPFDLLPPIHGVLVSHNHYDHMDEKTLLNLHQKFNPRIFVPLGDKQTLAKFGISSVEEMDWWQEIDLGDDLKVIFTPCQHWSARGLFDRDESLWGAFIVIYKGKKIYFAGDTGYARHFHEAAERYGPMDLAILPIGAYEPRWFMKYSHMNPEEAVQAHLDLKSELSAAMHFDTFQLADEPFGQSELDLKAALEKLKVPSEKFKTLKPGESLYL